MHKPNSYLEPHTFAKTSLVAANGVWRIFLVLEGFVFLWIISGWRWQFWNYSVPTKNMTQPFGILPRHGWLGMPTTLFGSMLSHLVVSPPLNQAGERRFVRGFVRMFHWDLYCNDEAGNIWQMLCVSTVIKFWTSQSFSQQHFMFFWWLANNINVRLGIFFIAYIKLFNISNNISLDWSFFKPQETIVSLLISWWKTKVASRWQRKNHNLSVDFIASKMTMITRTQTRNQLFETILSILCCMRATVIHQM